MNETIRSSNDNQDLRTSQRSAPEVKHPPAGECEGFEHLILQQHRHHRAGPYDISGMVPVQYGYEPEGDGDGQYEGEVAWLALRGWCCGLSCGSE